MLPQLILQQGHGPMRSVVAALCWLHSHQFLQERVDRAVRGGLQGGNGLPNYECSGASHAATAAPRGPAFHGRIPIQ